MRLFIAIPIPESVKQQLSELQQPIEGVRWQSDNNLHLTLQFLGEVDSQQVDELNSRLQEISRAAFTLTFHGCGYFPQNGQPRVLWVGIEEQEPLFELKQDIEKACASVGFESEDRPFKPHVTIGRIKGASKREVLSFVNQHKQFRIPDVLVDEFVLYESRLDPDGATHHRLKTFSLTVE